MRPLCVDLFCGTLAFSEGWRELGGRVIGFDLEHLPHHGPVPPGAELVLQDVRTLSGAQFKDASLIVASPPCPEYSWMAMPWRRAKQAAAALRGDGEFPSGYRGSRTIAELTALFDACFRIQREASEAAGHHIPLIVENVKGAQPWIGRARWHYGSFYLFGDVPALMPSTLRIKRPGRNFHAFENGLGSSPAFNEAEHETRVNGEGVKALAQTRGLQNFDLDGPRVSGAGVNRKAASAMIARIPLELSRHIARCYWPGECP